MSHAELCRAIVADGDAIWEDLRSLVGDVDGWIAAHPDDASQGLYAVREVLSDARALVAGAVAIARGG